MQQDGSCAAGSTLAVRALLPRPFELDLKHKFEARRWYHVVITHSPGGALSPAAVSLFVDGAPEAHAKFRFPKVKLASSLRILASTPPIWPSLMQIIGDVKSPSCPGHLLRT